MESLNFWLKRETRGSIEGRACANGISQRGCKERDEAASPTTMSESVMITTTIDAKQIAMS